MTVFERAIRRMRELGVGVQHFAVQTNHFHFIVECDDNVTLARAMKSFANVVAKALRRGRVLVGRFHLNVLKTPRAIRNAVRYVVFNQSRHLKVAPFVDAYSSAVESAKELLTPAGSWLMRKYGGLPSCG